MSTWHAFVGLISFVLSLLTTAYGGNVGLAIVTLSLGTRLLLLPLTLRMARHAQTQQKILQSIKQNVEALKSRYRNRPQKLAEELSVLYKSHGVKPIDSVNSFGMVAQIIIGTGLYSAIKQGIGAGGRFFWIRNLAQPNAVLAILTGVLTAAASAAAPHVPQQSRVAISLVPAVFTLILAWRLASGVVLYWAASTAVGGLQGLLLRRGQR